MLNDSPHLCAGPGVLCGGRVGSFSGGPRVGLPSLMILSSSEPPAAQAPPPSQREGCPGDQVTAQPQVSHRTSVFHNIPVLLPDGVAAPPPCPGPLSSDPTSRDPCPRDQIIPPEPELFCWVMVVSFSLPRPSLCPLRGKPIPLPPPPSQEHGLALRGRTVLF